MERRKKQSHRCSFCNFKSNHKSALDYHIGRHTGELPFLCDQCDCNFSRKIALQLHIQRAHPGQDKLVDAERHKCSLCPYATYWAQKLKRHQLKHSENRNFPCPHPGCGYAAKSSDVLEIHDIHKHQNELKFSCQVPKCGYRGKTPTAVRQHVLLRHSVGKPHVCDFEGCSYRAKTKGMLKSHKLGVHSGGYKPFACSKCNYRAGVKSRLRKHEWTHLDSKSVKCTFSGCTFTCKTNSSLKEHVLRRHTNQKFKCDFPGCSSSAVSQHILEKHKKFAHCEKVFKCPNCDYRAAKPSILRNHQRVHGPGQFIPCPQKDCPFQSRYPASITRHIRCHTADLGCPVEGCGFIGHSISGRQRHMKMHDPEGRPYQCLYCTKYFLNASQFSLHVQLSHTQEKPLKCPVCDYGSAQRHKIIQHVQKIHSMAFPALTFDEESTCDHCNLNFGSAGGLALHKIKLKTAVVVLTRLQFKV